MDGRCFSSAFLSVITTLAPIMNPVGCAVLFPRVAAGTPPCRRLALARSAGIGTALAILGAMWLGPLVVKGLSINPSALRLAGGALIALQAWRLMEEMGRIAAPIHPPSSRGILEIVFPFTVGPGTLVAAMGLGEVTSSGSQDLWAYYFGASSGSIALGLIIAGLYTCSDRALSWVGEGCGRTLAYISALLLLATGTELTLHALRDALTTQF